MSEPKWTVTAVEADKSDQCIHRVTLVGDAGCMTSREDVTGLNRARRIAKATPWGTQLTARYSTLIHLGRGRSTGSDDAPWTATFDVTL